MPIRTCRVSFTDADGLRHSVDVQAETLYEATALAVRAFQVHDCPPAPMCTLDVEARSPAVADDEVLFRQMLGEVETATKEMLARYDVLQHRPLEPRILREWSSSYSQRKGWPHQ